jgi:RimJ/RimL family protein N-acetyltransferase
MGRLVVEKEQQKLCGVISLSTIKATSAQIALVIPGKVPGKLIALEAMARMTEHGFNAMGLRRVWAGQAYPGLRAWGQRLETLGYRPEAIIREGFVKGHTISDSVYISTTKPSLRVAVHSGRAMT